MQPGGPNQSRGTLGLGMHGSNRGTLQSNRQMYLGNMNMTGSSQGPSNYNLAQVHQQMRMSAYNNGAPGGIRNTLNNDLSNSQR